MIRLLVALYPKAWRRAYGEEYAALLEQTRLTPPTWSTSGSWSGTASSTPAPTSRSWTPRPSAGSKSCSPPGQRVARGEETGIVEVESLLRYARHVVGAPASKAALRRRLRQRSMAR